MAFSLTRTRSGEVLANRPLRVTTLTIHSNNQDLRP